MGGKVSMTNWYVVSLGDDENALNLTGDDYTAVNILKMMHLYDLNGRIQW